ncbi:hypothetical protein Mgra_00002076 [Meloidogyne graminicola]|uniref:Phorbol-ester/DAG-type domain-containing protein n=1 Tax=Meloidogyne graminicola TaxID=189291 RepID=A0A8S9ZXD5_9BILA|nr:hypothetical protein Mgra_00002076 [Meloidogyne graminicola]
MNMRIEENTKEIKEQQQTFIDFDDFEQFIKEFNLKNIQKPSTSNLTKENNLNKELKHNWIECHFLTPTNCFNCNKKLWMRYGSKCSNCLIFVHDNCKDKLSINKVECFKQQQQHSSSSPLQYQQKDEILTNKKNNNNILNAGGYMTGWMNALLSPRFETLGPSSFFGTSRMGVYTQRNGGRYRTSSSSDAPLREALNKNILLKQETIEKITQEQVHNGRLRSLCKLMGSKTSGTAKEKCKQQKSTENICSKLVTYPK